ncbi:hypothetical protein NA56DRAFT_19849 [Hyaloscypha hepaticicola]|uniref:Uncharacterized protein n=1 Tax=Hyaloscypha hepaticicola TaxID=2082293 RepID=A0A2J6QQV4_9HELO|nr:hypothetical protein NA56DRAFT_19849 [Hyaloscypha hepaticicola]
MIDLAVQFRQGNFDKSHIILGNCSFALVSIQAYLNSPFLPLDVHLGINLEGCRWTHVIQQPHIEPSDLTGPRTFLDYNWVRGYIQGRIVIRDERENDWNAWLCYWVEVADELGKEVKGRGT